MRPLFGYSVNRTIEIPYFSLVICILGALWLVATTLFNIVSVGYENITVTSTTFENDIRYWYNKFTPSLASKFLPENWQCNGSLIKINDC